MELTILGSGTGLPTPTRGCPGHALEIDGKHVLLDLGSGTLSKLARAGIDFARIEFIFISHFHVDHSGDLASFLFSKKNPSLTQNAPLTIVGPPGIQELVATLQKAWPRWLDGSSYGLTIREAWDAPLDVHRARATPVPVVHTDRSVAWRFHHQGSTFTYSGDSDVCPGLVEAARDADLFLCECSFPDHMKVSGHLGPRTAGEMAEQAGARRLALAHFYPVMDAVDPVPPCSSAYHGEVVPGSDLLRIAV